MSEARIFRMAYAGAAPVSLPGGPSATFNGEFSNSAGTINSVHGDAKHDEKGYPIILTINSQNPLQYMTLELLDDRGVYVPIASRRYPKLTRIFVDCRKADCTQPMPEFQIEEIPDAALADALAD